MKFKYKNKITRFSCVFTCVMVLYFTSITPFVVSAGQFYPQYSVNLYYDADASNISFRTANSMNFDDPNISYTDYYFKVEDYLKQPSSKIYGSYWNPNGECQLRWYWGRMSSLSISPGAHFSPTYATLYDNTSYKFEYEYTLDMRNYTKDGSVVIFNHLHMAEYDPSTDSWFLYVESTQYEDTVELFDQPYYNSSTGLYHYKFSSEDLYSKSTRFPIGYTVHLMWYTVTSSASGGDITFNSKTSRFVPYFDSNADVPSYPNYDNGSLDDYNNAEHEVNNFVSGNLSSVTDMIGNGFRYLTGSFKNTLLYCGDVLTTLSNNDFLSILIPISLSLGFISFLLVGGGLISKSIGKSSGKKGG